jgi:hypothetical protein
MSSEDGIVYQDPKEAVAEAEQDQDSEYEQFLEWKRSKAKAAGLRVNESPLGDSVHKDTLKSYHKLGMEPDDTVRYATLRPGERMLHGIELTKNKAAKTWKILRSVIRVKDENTNDEYMLTSYALYFKKLNGDLTKLEYSDGKHEEVRGKRVMDHNYHVKNAVIEEKLVILDTPWDSKKFVAMLAENTKNIAELKPLEQRKERFNLEFIVGIAGRKGVDRNKPAYSIKNSKDFETGKFDELYQLGQRALSGIEPSLKKLSQPIAEDPRQSLYKRERGYLTPDKISYNQQSYR